MNELEQLTTQIRDTFEGLVNSVVHLQEYKTTARIHHSTLELIVGRIAEQEVDVIVNATNTALSGGSSDVDSAIHQAAGPQLAVASRTLAPCRTGDAVLTPGFQLPTPWVIHTVGPIYAGGQQDEAAVLDKAYRNSMRLAVQSGLTQIALPSISTGSYGYPIDEAAQIALGAVLEFIDGYRNSELLIRFVLYTRADFVAYDRVLKEFAEPSKAPATAANTVRDNISQNEDAEVSSTDASADMETEPEADAALDREEGEEQPLATNPSAEEEDDDEPLAADPDAEIENETDAHESWGNERARFVSIDMEAEPDVSLAITETDIEEAELESAQVESIKIGVEDIEAHRAADISIDSESIEDTLLFAEIESVMPVNLGQRERYVAQDDIQLVSARAELESALSELKSAQDEFRSIQDLESALRFTCDEPDIDESDRNRLARDRSDKEHSGRDEPLGEDSSSTSTDNERPTQAQDESAGDKSIKEDSSSTSSDNEQSTQAQDEPAQGEPAQNEPVQDEPVQDEEFPE